MLLTKYNGSRAALRSLGNARTRLLAIACCVLFVRPAHAQWALGPWEDATVVPRGVLRGGIAARWMHADERYARTSTHTERLGADFLSDTLGPLRYEAETVLPLLKQLTNLTAPSLSLGQLRLDVESMSWSTPIALEYGVTSRISLNVLVPYVKTRVEVFPRTNGTAGSATMGINPGRISPGAKTQNGTVVSELQSAASALQARLTTCLGSTAPSCSAINADRSGATALVNTANQEATALAQVYGTSTVTGSLFAPAANGALQAAVNARLNALDSDFTIFLGAPTSSAWIGQRPVPAAPVGISDLQALATDSAFGVGALPLADIEHSHLGDIEIGLKALLINSGVGATAGAPPNGFGARLSVAGIFRAGTAQKESADNLVDIGTGDGQNDVEVRAFLDLLAGRRWWMSVVARYGMQMKDEMVVRVPSVTGQAFTPYLAKENVQRDLGDFSELEITPRFAPNANFALSAYYRYRTKGADSYVATGGLTGPEVGTLSPAPDVSLLGIDTQQTEERVGFALTYSTVRGYSFHRSPWPLELSLMHTQVISGKGGLPKEFVTAVGLRLYRSIVGGDPMRVRR